MHTSAWDFYDGKDFRCSPCGQHSPACTPYLAPSSLHLSACLRRWAQGWAGLEPGRAGNMIWQMGEVGAKAKDLATPLPFSWCPGARTHLPLA